MFPEFGGSCMYRGQKWLVTDIRRSVFTGEVMTVDLRLTVIVNPKKRFKDEAVCVRNVPVSSISECA